MFHKEAYRRLKRRIDGYERPLVAFSGGLDSTLLLYAAKDLMGSRAAAVTVTAPYIPRTQGDYARSLAIEWGIDHFEVSLPLIPQLLDNPRNRCYLCKREMYREIGRLAREHGFATILDGSNADDMGAHRPGMEAVRELGVMTPLADERITKDMVRFLLASKGVSLNEEASGPCILTRLPYDTNVERELIERIMLSERVFHGIDIYSVRVRAPQSDVARIEVSREDMHNLMDTKVLDGIYRNLKELGWKYVTLDLGGYRTGPFDEEEH